MKVPTNEPYPEQLDCPYDFTSRCTMGRCDCKLKEESQTPLNTSNVNRVEVIKRGTGRVYVNNDTDNVVVQLQDDGKTIKIFLK